MKRIGRKLVAALLCCALAVQLLPMTVLAASVNSGDDYNEQVMAMLEEICDSEEDAQRYYAMLEEYGFMDEDGNAIDSWSIIMDGEEVTLEEIRDLLDDPFCDKSRYVVVDGTPVTLEDLETMIAIEDYIAYLEETYYTPQAWSEETLANLEDLVNQINTEGIEFVTEDETEETGTWSPSVDHDVRITAQISESSFPDVEVSLTAPQTEDVTFRWRLVEGSVQLTTSRSISKDGEEVSTDEVKALLDEEDCDLTQIFLVNGEEMTLEKLAEVIDEPCTGGTVTIPAGTTGPFGLSVDFGGIAESGRINGKGTCLIQIYDVTNALFEVEDEDGSTTTSTRWEDEIQLDFFDSMNFRETVTAASLYGTGQCSLHATTKNWTITGSTEGDKTSYTVSASFTPSEYLQGEKFAVELNFNLVFSRRYAFFSDDPLQRNVWDDAQYNNAKVTTPITFTTTVDGKTKESQDGTVSLAGSGNNNVSYTQTFYETGGSELWDGSTTYDIDVKMNRGEYTDPNEIYIA